MGRSRRRRQCAGGRAGQSLVRRQRIATTPIRGETPRRGPLQRSSRQPQPSQRGWALVQQWECALRAEHAKVASPTAGGKADEMRVYMKQVYNKYTWHKRQNGRATRHSQHGTDHDSMATSYYGAKRARRSEWSPSPWWLTRATPAASARFQAAVETWYSSAVLSSPRASTQLSTS